MVNMAGLLLGNGEAELLDTLLREEVDGTVGVVEADQLANRDMEALERLREIGLVILEAAPLRYVIRRTHPLIPGLRSVLKSREVLRRRLETEFATRPGWEDASVFVAAQESRMAESLWPPEFVVVLADDPEDELEQSDWLSNWFEHNVGVWPTVYVVGELSVRKWIKRADSIFGGMRSSAMFAGADRSTLIQEALDQ